MMVVERLLWNKLRKIKGVVLRIRTKILKKYCQFPSTHNNLSSSAFIFYYLERALVH